MSALLYALHDRPAFIVYRKSDKTPIDPASLHNSDAQNPATWMYPAAADGHVRRLGAEYGVGFVIHDGCGIGCIDIDKALINGEWSTTAHEICKRFSGAYVEVSQSGTGLHVFFSYKGAPPPHRKKNTALHVEFYTEKRFIGLTGDRAHGSPLFNGTHLIERVVGDYFPPGPEMDSSEWTTESPWHAPGGEDDAELVAKARHSRSALSIFGDKISFEHLWTADAGKLAKKWPGNTDGYDASSADQSLANRLIWWTGGNCERTAKLMRESALNRGKWDREEYLNGTIANALALIAKDPPTAKVTAVTDEPEGAKKKRLMPPAPVPSEDDPRPVILLSGGRLDRYAAQAEQLLADSVYVRGDALVRIGHAKEMANAIISVDAATGIETAADQTGTKRALSQAVIIPASGWLRRELMRRAQFWKYDKRSNEWEPRDCPKELAEDIANQKSWLSLRPLITTTSTPFLRGDFSVCMTPGYDTGTGIYYSPTLDFPTMLDAPTHADARAALDRLWEPISQFPFSTPEAGAAALSHIMTAVLRASFGCSPLFFYTAPIAASGKTKLAAIPSLIAKGVSPAQSPYTEREELRKVLFSSLLAGDSALILDNVPSGSNVSAPALAMFATSSSYADRVLGVSERREVPNRCTVAASGNNITPTGDLARRAIVVRLDPPEGKARGREFRITDLTRFIIERRAQYIVDVLTIVRAYVLAGRPKVAHPLESFEEWSAIARDPLVWLGTADPVATQQTETDDEVGTAEDVLVAIAAVVGVGHPFTAASLAQAVLSVPGTPGAVHGAALRDALMRAECEAPSDAKKLGYWLRDHRDHVGGGYKLSRGGGTKHKGDRSTWVVKLG